MIINKLKILSQGEGGEGVGFFNGKIVYVSRALVGDVVDVEIVSEKKSYIIAKISKIVCWSKNRVSAKCKISDVCGGCQLQSLDYNQQLKYKENKVCKHLEEVAKIDKKILVSKLQNIQPSDYKFRYRNKAQYPIRTNKNGKPIAGFFAENSHIIVENNDCLLSPKEFNIIISNVVSYMEENNIQPYNEETFSGCVRTVLIRKAFATGEILVCIVANVDKLKNYNFLLDKLKLIKGFSTLILNINKTVNNKIIGEETKVLYGKGYIVDELDGIKFKISALSFYQVNPNVAIKIYKKVLEYSQLNNNQEVWDICCGIGTISLFLAKKAKKVYGLEINDNAVKLARENAIENNIKNVEFVSAPAEDFLPKLEKLKADVFVLDPPRKGVEISVIQAIVKANPKKIVYVSCNPKSFAKDVFEFGKLGYELKTFQPFDQFCHTSHVEVVGLLEKIVKI